MVKLISVNIQGDKHIDKIKNLIKSVNPDVICMQEVMEYNVREFEACLGGSSYFSPMLYTKSSDRENTKMGVAIFSKLPIKESSEFYYYKTKDSIGDHELYKYKENSMVLLSVSVEKDGKKINIGTTHFTKSEDGRADEFQLTHFPKLMSALSKHDDIVFCGDFNAPRGMEIFSAISEKYKDNIDQKYTRSLDPILHRAPWIEFMVDGLFSTPEYKVSNMYFETGVSDHYAIVADIDKIK